MQQEFRIGIYYLDKRGESPNWYICWTEGSTPRRRSTGAQDFEQAKLVLSSYVLMKDTPVAGKPDEVAILKVLEDYYTEHAKKLPSSVQAKVAKKHLIGFFGTSMVSVINMVSCNAYVEKRRELGIARVTINRELAVLQSALNHARKNTRLAVVPHIQFIPEHDTRFAPPQPKGRPLSLSELARLYNAAQLEHVRLFFLVMMGTMCRPEAAMDLTADQLDFEYGLINLLPQGRVPNRKGRPVVPMTQFLRAELTGIEREYVIEYEGDRIASIRTAWHAMRVRAGFLIPNPAYGKEPDAPKMIPDPKVNPYSIRHTMSRELRRRRVPSEEISIMLGHRPPDVKRTDLFYAPFEPGYCATAAAELDRIYGEMLARLPVACQSLASRR